MAVVDQIDTGIEPGIFHPRIARDFSSPFRAVVADKVIDARRETIEAAHLRGRIRAQEFHPHDRGIIGGRGGKRARSGGRAQPPALLLALLLLAWARSAKREHGLVGGQKDGPAGPVSEKSHAPAGLADVGFEAERQSRVGLERAGASTAARDD